MIYEYTSHINQLEIYFNTSEMGVYSVFRFVPVDSSHYM